MSEPAQNTDMNSSPLQNSSIATRSANATKLARQSGLVAEPPAGVGAGVTHVVADSSTGTRTSAGTAQQLHLFEAGDYCFSQTDAIAGAPAQTTTAQARYRIGRVMDAEERRQAQRDASLRSGAQGP